MKAVRELTVSGAACPLDNGKVALMLQKKLDATVEPSQPSDDLSVCKRYISRRRLPPVFLEFKTATDSGAESLGTLYSKS
jgi:hypothetical protein